MDMMTVLGVLIGVFSVYFVMREGEIIYIFQTYQAALSALLVFGGTLGATLITYPFSILRQVPKALRQVIFPRQRLTPASAISTLVGLAETSKRQGLDALLEESSVQREPFLNDAIQMLVDGLPADLVRENLEKEIIFTRKRHSQISNIFRAMGTYAPIFGLLGTLIGVVEVLKNLEDPKTMGQSMAIAVTTTFFGIFGTNFLFLPIAGKLQSYSDQELLIKEVMIEGIIAIQAGEVPAMVTLKLQGFLAHRTRQRPGKDERRPAGVPTQP